MNNELVHVLVHVIHNSPTYLIMISGLRLRTYNLIYNIHVALALSTLRLLLIVSTKFSDF